MERKMTIALKSTDEVKQFVNDAMTLDDELDLISGQYVVDAKSILGIYSLNLSKPLELIARGNCGDELAVLDKYLI